MQQIQQTIGDLLDLHDKLTETIECLERVIATKWIQGDLALAIHDQATILNKSLTIQQSDITEIVTETIKKHAVGRLSWPRLIIHNGYVYERCQEGDGRPGTRRWMWFSKTPVEVATDIPTDIFV